MTFETLAFLAFVAVVVFELSLGVQPATGKTNLVSNCSLVVAVALLSLAGRVAYFVIALVLLSLGMALLILSQRIIIVPLSADAIAVAESLRNHWIGNFVYRTTAAIFHIVGVFTIPIAMTWSISDAYSNPDFFGLEIGHYVEGGFVVFLALVVLPMLIMPPGFDNPTLAHQKFEGWGLLFVGCGISAIWLSAQHLNGANATYGGLSPPDWDHITIGFIFGMAGLCGLLLAHQGIATVIHGAFPAAVLGMMLMHHVELDEVTDISENAGWTYIRCHQFYGLTMFAVGFCRLINKPVEACFFGFVTAFFSPMTTMWLCAYLDDALTNDYFSTFPTFKVVIIVLLTMSTMLFAINIATMGALRNLLDKDIVEYTSLVSPPNEKALDESNGGSATTMLSDSDEDDEEERGSRFTF